MNKQELIEKIIDLGRPCLDVVELVKQLDEPETGHADEAPRYVKNILARLRELPLHDREVWLKAIMGEFEKDFSHAKWREGYEQGKVEGIIEREKVKVPQLVADWIEVAKTVYSLSGAMEYGSPGVNEWINSWNNQDIFARAWLDGYEVEEEKRYLVTLKIGQPLVKSQSGSTLYFSQDITAGNYKVTRKELEEANFGWVFSCEGIEIVEVE